MFALRCPSFQDAGDVSPATLIEVNCFLEGVLNPRGRISLLCLFQLLGNDRGEHPDVLFVKGEDIGLLLAHQARLAFDQVPHFQLAVLYFLNCSPVSIGVHEIELMNFAVALQFQAEDCASTHRLIQRLTQDFRRRALTFYPFHQDWIAKKVAVGDVTGIAPLLI